MNENLKKILKNTGLILVIIVISALLVRYFSGSETLSEYAEKNSSTEDTSPPEEVSSSNSDEITSEDNIEYNLSGVCYYDKQRDIAVLKFDNKTNLPVLKMESKYAII